MEFLVKEFAQKYKDYVINLRREFHKFPEASFSEYKTSQMIKLELENIGIDAQIVADTGVVGLIKGGKPGKTVALRADIDGLPVTEQTQCSYASQHEGFMHACGHDAHIAIMLGAAKILYHIKDSLCGNVKLIFQPAEEIVKGARKLIAAGAFEGVDTIFGMHVWSTIPAGKISVVPGSIMASSDYFTIRVKGIGCHGSMPHQGVDVIVVGAAIVNSLQTIASREINPLEPVVVTVGEFKAGTKPNIIPGEAILKGTTRCFDMKLREELPNIVERIVRNTAQTYRAEIDFEYELCSPPVINDEVSAVLAAQSAAKIFGKDNLVPFERTPGGEDFSEYLLLVPGVFAFMGVQNPQIGANHPHHSSFFQIDEEPLIQGSATAVQYVLDYLDRYNS